MCVNKCIYICRGMHICDYMGVLIYVCVYIYYIDIYQNGICSSLLQEITTSHCFLQISTSSETQSFSMKQHASQHIDGETSIGPSLTWFLSGDQMGSVESNSSYECPWPILRPAREAVQWHLVHGGLSCLSSVCTSLPGNLWLKSTSRCLSLQIRPPNPQELVSSI